MAAPEVRSPKESAPGGHPWRIAAAVVVVVVLGTGAWGIYHLARRGGTAGPTGDQPLNVLLITADTTRADHLGCYGRANGQTPNMDRLAREGTRFAHCTTCVPLTLPSHASMMTAVYPYVHGARRNGTDYLSGANETLAETLKQAGYRTQATIASYVLNQCFGISQGFDVYHDVVPRGGVRALSAERRGDEVCEDALGMLRSVAPGRFFLWVHFYDPHTPYLSPRHPNQESPEAYEDEIGFMDTQIGRLLEELRVLGLQQKTLVILVGDHGESLYEHDERRHGYFLYEASLHVPCIMRCPGVIPAGQTIAAQVRTIDLAPTILDLLGRPPWSQAQGVSLVPLLSGRQKDLNLTAYAETEEAHDLFGFARLRSLTAGGWKYVLSPKPELYDLEHDAAETHSLADDRPELAADLREQLRQLLAEAPPPAEQEAAPILSPTDRARLESLGYVGSTAGHRDAEQTELERFEPQGRNPRDYAIFLERKSDWIKAMSDGRYKQAEDLVRSALEALPDVASLHADLADALAGQGRAEEAIQAYQQAIELAPNEGYPHEAYGKFLLLNTQRYKDAVDQLEIALDQDPIDTDVMQDLAAALVQLGRMDDAERHLLRATTIHPNSPRLVQALGALRFDQGRLDEAEECFRKALQLDPQLAQARAGLQAVEEARRRP